MFKSGQYRNISTVIGLDVLTFHLAPVAGHGFHLSCEISQHLLDRLAKKMFSQVVILPSQRMMTLVVPSTAPPQG